MPEFSDCARGRRGLRSFAAAKAGSREGTACGASRDNGSRTPFNPNIFHIRAGYADEAEHMVNHLVTINMRRIGVFYQNDAFGKAGLAGVEAATAARARPRRC